MSGKDMGKKVGITGVLISLAMIFSYVEAILPLSISVPGVKLGIANLVVIVAMYTMGYRVALVINCLRIVAVGLLFTGAFGVLYSMSGAVMSFLVMSMLKKSQKPSIIGVSMAGGVFHNVGQLLMAGFLVSNMSVFVYLPVLLFAGLVTGIIVGFLSREILDRLGENQVMRF